MTREFFYELLTQDTRFKDNLQNWAAAGFKDTLLRWNMKLEVANGHEKEIQQRVQG